jgi:hypothetical protein
MYAMNIQNDGIGLVLRENCKSKQMTDIIAWPSRCHGRIYIYTSSCYFLLLFYNILLKKCYYCSNTLFWNTLMSTFSFTGFTILVLQTSWRWYSRFNCNGIVHNSDQSEQNIQLEMSNLNQTKTGISSKCYTFNTVKTFLPCIYLTKTYCNRFQIISHFCKQYP